MIKSISLILSSVLCVSCTVKNSIPIEQLIEKHKVVIQSSAKDNRLKNISYYSKPVITDYICRTKVVYLEARFDAAVNSFKFYEKEEYELVRVTSSNKEAVIVCDYIDIASSTFEVSSDIDNGKLIEVLSLFRMIVTAKVSDIELEYESEDLKKKLESLSAQDIVKVSKSNDAYILHFMEYDSFFKIIIELGESITAKVVY